MFMSLAKKINRKLDDILALQAESDRVLAEVDGRKKLINSQTGERITKKKVLELAQLQIDELKNELNQITNNGKNIKGIFDCEYYVNDMLQDKLINEQENYK